MTNPSAFNTALVWPILNVLVAIYDVLYRFRVPFALGFAIILLTALIRIILYPLTSSQLKASKKMQDLAPHISNLKTKHKGDSKRIQAETMKLYKTHGVNPAAGCLPTIIQLPIIWGLYSVLQQIVRLDPKLVVHDINKIVYFPFLKLTSVWNQTFFGLPLGKGPSQLLHEVGFLILLVPLVTGLLQFLQSKMMAAKPPKNALTLLEEGKKAAPEKKSEDFASAFQTQSMFIFPIMIGFFSFTFPLGLSLYWNTFTVFGIMQQYKIAGWGGLTPWVTRLLKK